MIGPQRHTRGARRISHGGQALIEMALVAPLLVMLLLGATQIGAIAYTQVSLDTAAREGARAGIAAPNAALSWDTNGTVPSTHQCTTADFAQDSSGNPACIAVVNAAGFLDQSLFTTNPCGSGQACITLQVIGSANLASAHQSAAARLMAASPCNNGNQATISGTVSGIPGSMTATVTDTSGDAQSGVTGSYTLCASATRSGKSQTFTAQVGAVGCGGYSGSVGPLSVVSGQSYTENITLTAEAACSTPTPTPTTPPSPTPTPTAGPTPTPTSGPATSCASQVVPDSNYITVSISYPEGLFVPFISAIFQSSSSGIRQVTTTVTYAIDPCTLTKGA